VDKAMGGGGIWFMLCVGLLSTSASAAELRLNDIQMLGSHNSYKQSLPLVSRVVLSLFRPELIDTLDYQHPPLTEQLDFGLRKLELDVFYDPKGTLFGQYAHAGGISHFAVLHVQSVDDASNCPNLKACITDIAAWSRAHPGHLPLFISINAKDAPVDWMGAVEPQAFDDAAWDRLDEEFEEVLGDRLIRPASVIGPTGPVWPPLSEARGRIVVVLDERGLKRERYARKWPTRSLFADHHPEHPAAAIRVLNDPIADFDRIRDLVEWGYIVRTRADADTVEARNGDTERRDRAFESGAQLISTDYYRPAEGTGYVVRLPRGANVRCNPVRVTGECPL
tara:strand:+ start:1473 stop:2483 length:1011 start_codon:yes stop_codon:yes gene_type:complete